MAALSVFLQGDFADFSRSLGVFSLLLLLRARPGKITSRIVGQLKAVVADRRPFPPGSSPWRYRPQEDEEDLGFSMLSVLFVVAFSSGYLGWNLSKPIPLIPSWLFGLLAAIIGGYSSTLQDTIGDLLRLYGYLIHSSWSELTLTADEVDLRVRTSQLFSQVFFFLRGVDDQFQVMDKVHTAIAEVAAFLTSMLLRSRSPNAQPPPQPQAPRGPRFQRR